MKDYKILELRVPLPLWEQFLLAFPNRGERNWILNQVIGILSEWSFDTRKSLNDKLLIELGGKEE